jgi:hypothetical protein
MKVGFEASVGLQKRWTNCEKEIDKLLYREKIMWMQRSHIAWLREGDRNTKYFHRMACWRRKKNNIWKLKSRDRTWTSDTKEMENMSRGVFQTLYTRDLHIEPSIIMDILATLNYFPLYSSRKLININ